MGGRVGAGTPCTAQPVLLRRPGRSDVARWSNACAQAEHKRKRLQRADFGKRPDLTAKEQEELDAAVEAQVRDAIKGAKGRELLKSRVKAQELEEDMRRGNTQIDDMADLTLGADVGGGAQRSSLVARKSRRNPPSDDKRPAATRPGSAGSHAKAHQSAQGQNPSPKPGGSPGRRGAKAAKGRARRSKG